MKLVSRLMLPVLALLFSSVPALAQDGAWTVSEAKGSVIVVDARGERSAKVGTALVPGATVRTAARASAVLVRGREFVTLRQNAQIRIPEAAKQSGLMQIIQDYGSALFNIGKQPNPHFGVETPYLAAVVKGTTFVITVKKDAATLQVTEGAVEASTKDGGVRELIRSGTIAMIAAGDPLRMVIEGEGAKVVDSPARAQSGTAAATEPGSTFAKATEAKEQTRVEEAVFSTPQNLGKVSNGFIGGEVAVLAASVAADNTRRGTTAPAADNGGRSDDSAVCSGSECGSAGSGNGNGNANGAGNGNANGNGNGNGNANGTPPSDPGVGGNGNGNANGAGNGNGNGNGNDNRNDNGNPPSDPGAGGNGNGNGNGAGNGNDRGNPKGGGNADGPKGRFSAILMTTSGLA